MKYLFALSFALLIGIEAAKDCSAGKERGFKCSDAPSKQQFFYDADKGTCVPFYYLGCGGNGNAFDNFDDCNKLCVEGKGKQEHEHKQNTTVDVCDLLTDAKISEPAQKCGDGINTPCHMGYQCNKGFCCPTQHYICRLPASSGNEREAHKHYGRYVYMPGLNNCIRFSYFGEEGNFNNFKTYKDCSEFCKVGQKKKKEPEAVAVKDIDSDDKP